MSWNRPIVQTQVSWLIGAPLASVHALGLYLMNKSSSICQFETQLAATLLVCISAGRPSQQRAPARLAERRY